MNAFVHRPKSVRLRRALFQVHLWIGISVGLYIAIVCLTGAALVFRIDLQRAAYPHLFTPSANGPLVDAATVMERVKAAYPDGRLSGVDAPTTTRPTYLAYVSQGRQFATVLVDPVSAQVLGELPDRSWVRTLQDLHFDLLSGRTGRLINGIGAALMLVMALTGLVIWWPGVASWRRSLTVDFHRSWKRVTWDLHSAIGFWTALIISLWSITGIAFAFPSQFRAAVNWMSPVSVIRAPSSGLLDTSTPSPAWRKLVEQAQRRMPGQFVARVVVPATSKSAFLVMFSSATPTPIGTELAAIYLDQHTGALLHEPARGPRTWGDAITGWVSPLHVGNFGGNGIRMLWFALALSPPVLFVTGFLMWWTRLVSPRRARALANQAVEA